MLDPALPRPALPHLASRSLISLVICAYSAHSTGLKTFFGSFKHYHMLFSRGAFGAASMQVSGLRRCTGNGAGF